MDVFSAALLLFLVMDPFGNVPFFLTALKPVEPSRQRLVVLREVTIALVVLVVFLFSGQYILRLMQISGPALTASGGTILFLIAIRMLFPRRGESFEEDVQGEPFIVPLAIPYIAGPSAMATLLLIMNREPSRWMEWLVALLIAWTASAIVIFSSSLLVRYLNEKVLIAIERLMGMLLIALSIQMLMTGIAAFVESVG